MDPNSLRHLEFFSVPNNQTVNPVDQPFSLAGASSALPPTLWDAALNPERSAPKGPPSTALPTLSLESLIHTPATTGPTSASPHPSISSRRPSFQGSQSSQGLPTRAPVPRRREGHERKRSRVGAEANPFDSADYWIQFDKEDALGEIPESEEFLGPDLMGKGKVPTTQRRPTGSLHGIRPPGSATTSTRRATMSKSDEYLDDDALENALSDDDAAISSMNLAEHLAQIESAPPTDIPQREGLYSTPLSWERPQPGIRMDTLTGLSNNALNEAEQRRLIAIAMNPGSSMGGLGSNLNLFGTGMTSGFNPALSMGMGMGMGFGGPGMGSQFTENSESGATYGSGSRSKPTAGGSSSGPQGSHQRQDSLMNDKGKDKQKLGGGGGGGGTGGGDRTAHNDIERKYRTNLKDKIAELRDAVPALHTIAEDGEDEDGGQPSRNAKVSKGTILTKATEYIHQLERRNRAIAQEHLELSRRLQAFEQLLHATARASYQMPNYSRTLFDPRGFC
ncbi:helix-loop-helix DNA-binding domain-containing protein [Apodospora peruviana]|uniref:Helix-loop-helix DNA-binding domain-containing protein n=1 Tax=Apodospora peruviana TaxID=516989 RepID=A0AAE0I178_9PEZI|nr:helix-loop-helix DNA-binding domain-containing protein [Apodospora peruviana]